ncbi:hypothetical protein [Vallitalea guaymasensis]|uniref:Uncharacterized protein n=1 Tax=Vallitalea guaymasensis TaxID=1185412 RepID=A0A8J8M7R0_9FIRM|nr:hypothetical protein [Vallitalea guaymasensis]QUH27798.1 hypothetical protein HYG85_02250 [Vallitalea guaymasensis]
MKLKGLKKVVSCMLVLGMVFSFSLVSYAAEDYNEFDSFKISNGFGYVGKAGVRLTAGAEADINIKMNVKTVTQDQLVEFIETHKDKLTADQYSEISENSSFEAEGMGANLFNCLVSVVYGDGSSDYFANARNKEVLLGEEEDKAILKELKDITEQEYELSGTIKARGLSYIPTEAYCFVEVTRIQFKDGSTLKVINTNATVAEGDGTRDAVTGSEGNEPLNLIPLG